MADKNRIKAYTSLFEKAKRREVYLTIGILKNMTPSEEKRLAVRLNMPIEKLQEAIKTILRR